MRLAILVSSVAIALTFGSVSAQTPAPSTPISAQERADLARMRDLHLSGPRPAYTRTLDLSNRTHYRHFMAQLARAGVLAERYPQLFKSIEETRQSHVAAARRPKAAAFAVAGPAAACGNDQVCAANLLSTFGAPATNPLYFQVTALSSIPNNPAVAMNIVGLYDQGGTVFAPPVQVMQHGTGYDVENTVTGSAPQTTTRVQAQGVWYYQPTSGGGVPGTFYAAVAPGQDPAIVNTSPTNVKGAQQIKVCVTRQDSDCDYFYQAIGGQQVVRFPLSGNVTYPNPIAADGSGNPLNGTASVTLSQPSPNQGGTCTPLPITQNFISLARVSNNVVSWNIDPAQFGVATPCFPSNSQVIFDLMLTVYDTSQTPWLIAITSEQGPPQSNLLRIWPMTVVYGCVAEGTLVTMADDTQRPIEKIRAGDVIRSNAQRLPLTVDNYTMGYEKPPMVSITTANGRSALLTEGHPVVTAAGIKLASKLTVGDTVVTDEGEAKLVKVERQQFNGNVWNLDVGRHEDRVRLTDTNTTFYANGILVGDRQMQARMQRVEHESTDAIRARIDKKWLVDFENNLIDTQARRAAP